MVFSYDYVKQKGGQHKTNAPLLRAILMAMQAHWSNTDGIAQCRMSRATTEATRCRHQATTRFLSPQWPPGRQQTKQRQNIHLLCWPFQWPWQCAGTYPRTLPNGGGPGLY
jgi:hypothetical protein